VQYTEATDNTSKRKKKMKSMLIHLSAWRYPWQSRSWKVWWQILY